MNCKDFRDLIDSYLSDELLTETNHSVLGHIEICVDCRKETETRRFVRVRLRMAFINSADYTVSDDFCERMKQRVAGSPNKKLT